MFLSGCYLLWGAVGKYVTGTYPFFWMDEEQVGSKEAVSIYCTGFVILAPISECFLPSAYTMHLLTIDTVYTMMQGCIGIRESLTRRADSRGANESLDS